MCFPRFICRLATLPQHVILPPKSENSRRNGRMSNLEYEDHLYACDAKHAQKARESLGALRPHARSSLPKGRSIWPSFSVLWSDQS